MDRQGEQGLLQSTASKSSEVSKTGLNRYGVRAIAGGFVMTLGILAVLLISAGKIGWANAWVYIGVFLILEVVASIVLIEINPEVLNERGKFVKEGTKPFDKVFISLFVPLNIAVLTVAGLDAARYKWSAMPFDLVVLGVVLLVLAPFIGLWAMAVNPYFECTVRIQEDKDQQVITSGPYGIVRHPGYSGGIIESLLPPLVLGSWWALIPAGLIAISLVIRTILEDRTLQNELPGYKEYAEVTRYRLIPFVW